MTNSNGQKRAAGSVPRDGSTHLFTVGQTVRLKGGPGEFARSTDIYRITGTLPPRGNSPQYRIRNDCERHDRVATQDSLEPLRSPKGERASLVERTFGPSKGKS
jgi:hypothetical protein